MRGNRGAASLATAVLLPLVVVTGCGGATPTAGGDTAAVSTQPSAEPSTPSTPSTQPSSTVAAPEATTQPTPTTVAPSASPTATTTASATASVAPRWAKALGEPQQGDPVWGVYLAVGHSATDAPVEKAVRDASRVGYQAVVGDIACDGGAMDALGLDQYDYWSGATLYFATEADARGFAAAYTRSVAAPKGVAKVTVGCLD
ncbi:MAG: hypothetical protein ACTHLJ_15785 [Angustibacter sp.]